MDSARAKSIILLLLLSLNIFLLISIAGYARAQGIPRETIQNTVSILKSRDIRLECAIPSYNGDTPRLVCGKDIHDQTLITEKLMGKSFSKGTDGGIVSGTKRLIFYNSGTDNGVMDYSDSMPQDKADVTTVKNADSYVRNYLKGSGLIDASFVLDSHLSYSDGSTFLKYVQKFKGYLVFDNYLNVRLTNKGIIAMSSKARKIIGLSRDKTGDISAAYQILLGNFKDTGGLTITRMDFGYKNADGQEMAGLESSEQLPAWRVTVKGEAEPRYFSCSDGKPIK